MPTTEHLPAVTPNAGRFAPWNSSRQRSGDGGRWLMKTNLVFFCAIFVASCSLENTDRSDKPVTRIAAENALHQKLPSSASDVYYLFYSGGLQVLESFLRFHVDPSQADQAIQELIEENNREMKRTLPYSRSALPPAKPVAPHTDSARPARFKPISWWQPQTARNGYFRGERQSYALSIWYDSDNSEIYVYKSD